MGAHSALIDSTPYFQTQASVPQSLGCTLFAVAYGHSPFETSQTLDQGGSLAMAVMNGSYKHPADNHYSEGLRRLIDIALIVDPAQRCDIHQVSLIFCQCPFLSR